MHPVHHRHTPELDLSEEFLEGRVAGTRQFEDGARGRLTSAVAVSEAHADQLRRRRAAALAQRQSIGGISSARQRPLR